MKIVLISTIDHLIPRHDYGKENCYLIFYHQAKPTQTKEIKADWFDYNRGEKILWLLVRIHTTDEMGLSTIYKNIKFKNIDPTVKIVQQNQKKGCAG